jgi:hypothetical protein
MLLVLPVLLLACILIAYRAPLPGAVSASRDLVAAVTAGLAGAGYLLGLAVYLLLSLRRSARALDPRLEALGLTGHAHGGFGRQYVGELAGRPVEVRFLPAQAMRPARLDLFFTAQGQTRMAVGWQRPLLDCRDCKQVDLGPEVGYSVFAEDPETTRELLAGPNLRPVLDRLMEVEGEPVLYVQPDRLWYRVRPWSLEGAEVEGWLRALARLGGA